jgi:hypothetical protein
MLGSLVSQQMGRGLATEDGRGAGPFCGGRGSRGLRKEFPDSAWPSH